MNLFFHAAAFVASIFYLVLLRRLSADQFREFTALFLYLAVLFLTTAVDYYFVFLPRQNPFGADPRVVFYIDDLSRQAMIYVIVISLIRRAVPVESGLHGLRRRLLPAALVVAVMFLLFFRQDNVARWMTNVVRNLSILAMLLNMCLWLLLIRGRSKDKTLVLVVSGLGLQMAGEVIGQSFRLLSQNTVMMGNVILTLSHLLCLWVWTQALGLAPKSVRPSH